MNILITADPEIPVPPINYGGIERIIDSLIKAYNREGHTVFLVAHEDSKNNITEKNFSWPNKTSKGYQNIFKNSIFLTKVVKNIKPDVIHSFSRLLYLYPNLLFKNIPVVQTYQREISVGSTKLASMLAGNNLSFTCCGEHMIKNHPLAEKFTPVHNFTDTNFFIPNKKIKKNILFFLGRIEDIKGTREAVEVSLATNQKLIIAGNVEPEHKDYFDKYIKPNLDSDLIQYVGPVNDEQKLYYFQRSKAFLFPIKWEEPFGIVMAEAMACGVPVIGFDRGSVPEVVKNDKTGFIVNNTREMIEAVNKIEIIDRYKVREDCEARFSLEVISKRYLSLFNEKLASLKIAN